MRWLVAACWLYMPLAVLGAVSTVDETGATITLDKAASRIVSLTPHATEILFAIGAASQVVARDAASDFPTVVAKLPAVGHYGSYNVEAIVALRPDLIVSWDGAQAGSALRKLRTLGIPIFSTQPSSIAQLPQTMRALGQLTGRPVEAQRKALAFEQAWLALGKRYAASQRLNVVPQVSNTPPMTVNDQQFTASVFRACNATNPFGAATEPVPVLSREAVAATRPDAIVALASPTEAKKWLAQWRALPSHTAFLQADAATLGRPGPRVLGAAERLCSQLDPLRNRAAPDQSTIGNFP